MCLQSEVWAKSVYQIPLLYFKPIVVVFVFHSLNGRTLKMSPGTMKYQIFVIILCLPATIRSAVCCNNHVFHLAPTVILLGKVSLEGLYVLVDQRDYRLNRIEYLVILVHIYNCRVTSSFGDFWQFMFFNIYSQTYICLELHKWFGILYEYCMKALDKTFSG